MQSSNSRCRATQQKRQNKGRERILVEARSDTQQRDTQQNKTNPEVHTKQIAASSKPAVRMPTKT
jgi:hypothetical protein